MAFSDGMTKPLQRKLLGSVVEFMATVGLSERETREAFAAAIAKLRKTSRRFGQVAEANYQPDGDVSANLLRMWFRDSRLVEDGPECRPRPLSLSKGRGSLTSLIKKLDPQADSKSVIKSMKALGLIKRTSRGLYLPTANAAVLPRMHPWVVEHAARSVIRFVSTIHRNSNPTSGQPPLLERYSYVPDLDPSDARAFAEFARIQGLAYLDTLDDWMEHRRVDKNRTPRRGRSSGIPAGVHLITFLGAEADSSVASERKRGSRLKSTVTPSSHRK